ncbi:hypothetical protein C7293_11470 [filamentous cyanobacterium CCT1]|nr:hypothetical protein C7293_11470 [filamentous cyanobacterium CCT1]PSN79195.1 hypothetical protein C8B47_13025 [filamentous cyanobacterium CCP4]
MKRFILGSLSATMALALGATAQAQTNIESRIDTAAARENVNTAAARSLDEGVLSRFEYRQNSLTSGVLSPDDLGPNNRAWPTDRELWVNSYEADSYSSSDRTNQRPNTSVPGVVAPNSQSPNNRATPGQGTTPNQQQPMMDMDTQNQDTNLPGVVAPNSQSPNNRTTPDQGSSYPNQQQPMMDTQNQDTNVPGVVAPNSQSPNNRTTPGQ